jgi:glucose dehydrogenase
MRPSPAEPARSATDGPTLDHPRLSWWRRLIALALLALGLAEFVAGFRLVQLGGSTYYLLAGLLLAAAGASLWFNRPLARVIFHLWLGGTMLWSLIETGGEFWGMVSRVGYPMVIWLVGLLVASDRDERRRPARIAPHTRSAGDLPPPESGQA